MLKLLLSNNSITIGNDACEVSIKLQKTKIVFFYDFLLAEKINFTQKSKSRLFAPLC